MILIVEDLSRVLISRVTGHVISEHKDDSLIRYSKSLDCPVNTKVNRNKTVRRESTLVNG